MFRELNGTIRPSKKSVFVVGNGPSLKNFEFSIINTIPWVGMNAAYRHWAETDIYPTYYACLDLIVGQSHQKQIEELVSQAENLGIQAFLLRNDLISRSKILSSSSRVQDYDAIFRSLPKRVYELVTTGSHAALWMESLGYEEIILLGIDANYEEKVSGSMAINDTELKIESLAENPNYYFAGYQREGDRYTVPNPIAGVHSGAWRRCAQYLQANGTRARIYNASPISEIDSFSFISMEDLFGGGAKIVSPMEQLRNNKNRVFKIKNNETSFNLNEFLDRLCPAHIAQYKISGEGARDVSGLSRYGWSRLSGSNPDVTRALLSSVEPATDHSEAVSLAPFKTREQAEEICEKKLESNDTVLLLSVHSEGLILKVYPCFIDVQSGHIVAFRSTRFWASELKRAITQAVGGVPRFMSSRYAKRKIRATLSKLRSLKL